MKVTAIYFSATETTKKNVLSIAGALGDAVNEIGDNGFRINKRYISLSTTIAGALWSGLLEPLFHLFQIIFLLQRI